MQRRATSKPCAKCGVPKRRKGQSYCSSCHTGMVNSLNRAKQAWLQAYKLELGCCDCGYDECARALHLDHRDPTTKDTRLKGKVNHAFSRLPWDALKHEATLCDVRCANCHAEKHDGN